MDKVIIYGLGQVFQFNKHMINWNNVIAAVDKKVKFIDGVDNIEVVTPENIVNLEYDFIVIFSNKLYESIKRTLIFEYFINESKIISWKVYLNKNKEYFSDIVKFICDFIEKNSINSILDCCEDKLLKYFTRQELNNESMIIDRYILYNTELNYEKYDNLYDRKDKLNKSYEIIVSQNLNDISKMKKICAKYYMCIIPYFNKQGEHYKQVISEFADNDFEYNIFKMETMVVIILNKKNCNKIFIENQNTIYVVTHKKYNIVSKEGYIPIIVGDKYNNRKYINDRVGDNIAHLNKKINECTAMYWIWKNTRTKYVGLNHYRRYFLNNNMDLLENILDESNISNILNKNDIILCNNYKFNETVLQQIANTVDKTAFDKGYSIVKSIFKKIHPEDMELFDYVMELHYFYPCNMFVTSWDIFDKYCEWLFAFIIEAAESIDVSDYDDYSKRIIGFFAERMMTVWVLKNNLKVKELPFIVI